MTQEDVLKTALDAADRPIMLESAAQVSRAAKAWRRAGLLALDTEFVRERTYHADLGLVQLSDGQTVWLIDPLIDGVLAPLAELLADPAIVKLLHSPSEDLEVLLHTTGELPEPLVDSQLACALLGQPLQLGYHKAAEWLLGIPIDKDLTRSNWLARPLRPELLRYAALDVCVLPLMWADLRERLDALGRLPWLEEDCTRMLVDAKQPVDPDMSWARIRGVGRLEGDSLAVLQSLAAWREQEARERNRPRGFIVKDPVLLAIARERMEDPRDLESLADFHPRARQRYGQAITRRVQAVLASGATLPVPPQAGPKERETLKTMRKLVARAAEELELEPTVLATKKDMEALLFGGPDAPLPERLTGWRRPIVGDPLKALLA
ncbi:MAG: ribonuclease D [Xanthomonadales bacterium]|jgi:ribonuclease D|nr:ribonuclease D [Xanthomonadales bacterium]